MVPEPDPTPEPEPTRAPIPPTGTLFMTDDLEVSVRVTPSGRRVDVVRWWSGRSEMSLRPIPFPPGEPEDWDSLAIPPDAVDLVRAWEVATRAA